METVEVFNRLLRLREEKKQIETEMLSFLAFYKEKAQQLTSEAGLLKSTPSSGASVVCALAASLAKIFQIVFWYNPHKSSDIPHHKTSY